MKQIVVAIDGPAGAGKSTVARLVAKDLGYIYVDTGAMYRALTFKVLTEHIDLADEVAIGELAKAAKIQLRYDEHGLQHIYLDGRDVSEAIRDPQVSGAVSQVASYAAVRQRLVELQRELAMAGGVVMDGRDIGTTVVPQAQLKIYLTASIEERARRRYVEMLNKGYQVQLEQLKQEIADRDRQDMSRAHAPLQQASDAVLIDSSNLTIAEVVQQIVGLCERSCQ